jgi:DNA-directed RNA polymerase subunit RPC12/RpoP
VADTINMLCLACGEPSYVTEEEASNLNACPRCGDPGIPADLDDTATVTLTKHELRILTFWAEAYARMCQRMKWDNGGRMDKVLNTIFDRLSMQTDTALTIRQEMADLRSTMTETHGHQVDLVLIDTGGKCVECGEQLNFFDEDALFSHVCGVTDEPASTDEDTTPPFSS